MPLDPARQHNRSDSKADFTYTMVLDVVKIQDTGKGAKPVADDLEEFHGRSRIGTKGRSRVIGSVLAMHKVLVHQIEWDGKEARVCRG
jgi:hypothetical protein